MRAEILGDRLRRVGVVTLLALAIPGIGESQDLRLYSDDVLMESRETYAPNLRWNLRNTVFPLLRPEERAAVDGARIEVPLRHPRDPLTYLSSVDPPLVIMSAASLKFLDDLFVAFAWLDRRGYSTETVLDYLSRLKYRSQSGLTATEPLDALSVPAEEAYEDPNVNRTALNGLTTAVVFILAHEVGHIVHGHGEVGPVSAQESQAWEREADEFALEIFRRMRAPPLGIATFFTVTTYLQPHRADFSDLDAWRRHLREAATHPLSGSRVRALADAMSRSPCDFARTRGSCDGGSGVGALAGMLEQLGEHLDDPDLQHLAALRARASVLSSLAPRRFDELLPSDVEQAPEPGPFQGRYEGVVLDSSGEASVSVELRRSDDVITGRFSYGIGEGWLLGRVENGVLDLRWGLGEEGGQARWTSDGEALSGTWGSNESSTGRGRWRLSREP